MRIGKSLGIGAVRKLQSVTYDADAQAYFTANTAITSATDKTAINTFYLGLKSDGIYNKIDAMYLPIWGSASASKWNLINPLDNNTAFRLTYSTGWTFSSGGMTPVNAYANTFLNPSVLPIPVNDIHISFYSRTNVTPAPSTDIGCWTNPSANYTLLALGTTLGSYAGLQQTSFADYPVFVDADSRGLYVATRTSNNLSSIYKNGTLKDTSAQLSTGNGNNTFFIGSGNGNSSNYSTKQCCFSSIGRKFTDTQAANFSNRVNTLMTYFGINTY